jgi:hypothetical protein
MSCPGSQLPCRSCAWNPRSSSGRERRKRPLRAAASRRPDIIANKRKCYREYCQVRLSIGYGVPNHADCTPPFPGSRRTRPPLPAQVRHSRPYSGLGQKIPRRRPGRQTAIDESARHGQWVAGRALGRKAPNCSRPLSSGRTKRRTAVTSTQVRLCFHPSRGTWHADHVLHAGR